METLPRITTERTPDSVLADIDGWQDASWRELTGGLNNRTFVVEADGRRAVLKIDDAPRRPPFNAREAESRIQSRAAEHGLANRVLYSTSTVYMTEYVEGSIWSSKCLEDNRNLDHLAAALRKLHSLPLTGRTFDAVGAAREYVRRIRTANDARVRDCLRKIEASPLPPNLCCCHNDLVAANIINTPDVHFLDWEYACDNDPFFDLATVVAHHRLTGEQRDYLLDAYFDGDGGRWKAQLDRQADVYEALLWLWEASRA